MTSPHKILLIESSARGHDSQSRQACQALLARWPDAQVTRRDLRDALPHIDAEWVLARTIPAAEQTKADRKALALSDALIAELKQADIVIIGTPLYNFGVPAALKAWIDLVARPNVTFKYISGQGPIGLLDDRPAHVVLASGGMSMNDPDDYATPHLRRFLRFIGITDVTEHAAEDLLPKA